MSEAFTEILRVAERAAAGSEADKSALARLVDGVDLAGFAGAAHDRAFLAALLDWVGMREQAMLALRPDTGEGGDHVAGSANLAGMLASGHGEYGRARELFLQALSAIGDDPRLRVKILANLAALSMLTDEPESASRWMAQANEANEASGQAGDPAADVLLAGTQFGIARARGSLDGQRAALLRLNQATRARIAELGSDHPLALTAVASLAAAEFELASAEGSVEAQERVIAVLEVAAHRLAADLGADHPQTLTCLENLCVADFSLARTGRAPDRKGQAASRLEAVAKRTSAALGEDHPQTRVASANAEFAKRQLRITERSQAEELPVPLDVRSDEETHHWATRQQGRLAAGQADSDAEDDAPSTKAVRRRDAPGSAARYLVDAGASPVKDSRRVFLSHTTDLARFPERRSFVAAAKDAVARAGYAVADMEYFTARESSPAEYCRQVVRACDVYVGLIGPRYGSAVRDQPDVSYTELEFDVATQAVLPRLVFLLDEDAVPPAMSGPLLEGEPAFQARQAAFRQRLLGTGLTVRTVASPDQLELLLFQALIESRLRADGYAQPSQRQGAPVRAGQVPGPVEFSAPAPVALAGLPAEEGFLGRADDLSVVEQILAPDTAGAETVVVSTVAGLAGVGKTAFAVRAARRAMDAGWFSGGVVFVDLHGYDPNRLVDADAALGALIRALGVPNGQIPPERGEREALYRARLAELAGAGRRVLIIADNASSLDQVAPLRPGSPVHRMLVTSRHNLPLYGARRIEVDVLSQADAVAVVDRALRAANPGDERIPGDMEAARKLVELCGCLPLALRITAELLADEPERPVAELVEILSDTRGRLGEIAYGDSLEVRAAFDASYRHLPADQRQLFRMLSLNPGPHIRIGATAALAGIPEPLARQMLVALRRAHLIQRAPSQGCYRFHDLLRLYATERSEQEDPPLGNGAAVSRLLDYYLDGARDASRDLEPPLADPRSARLVDRPRALAWLEAERPNLVAAVSLAADTGHDSHARDIPLALFGFFDLRKHWAAWIATHQIALSAARRLGDRRGEGVVLNNLGVAYRQRRQFDEALACHSQAFDLSASTGDRHGEGRAMNNSGVTYRDLRHFDDALACHQRAVAICRDISDRRGEAEALYNLGNTYEELRRFDDAVTCFQRALALYRDVGDRYGEGWAVNGIGVAYRELRRLDDALDSFRQALAIRREVGDRYGEGWAVNGIGVAYRELRRFDDALDSFRQALAIRREIGDRHGEGHTLTSLGATYSELMRLDDARDTLRQALAIRREIDDRHGEGVTLQCLGRVHRGLGQLDEALNCYQQALAAFEETSAPYDTEQTKELIAILRG